MNAKLSAKFARQVNDVNVASMRGFPQWCKDIVQIWFVLHIRVAVAVHVY